MSVLKDPRPVVRYKGYEIPYLCMEDPVQAEHYKKSCLEADAYFSASNPVYEELEELVSREEDIVPFIMGTLGLPEHKETYALYTWHKLRGHPDCEACYRVNALLRCLSVCRAYAKVPTFGDVRSLLHGKRDTQAWWSRFCEELSDFYRGCSEEEIEQYQPYILSHVETLSVRTRKGISPHLLHEKVRELALYWYGYSRLELEQYPNVTHVKESLPSIVDSYPSVFGSSAHVFEKVEIVEGYKFKVGGLSPEQGVLPVFETVFRSYPNAELHCKFEVSPTKTYDRVYRKADSYWVPTGVGTFTELVVGEKEAASDDGDWWRI